MAFHPRLGRILGVIIVAVLIYSCSTLTTVTLTLKPQDIPAESCSPPPAYRELGIKKIAVLRFSDYEQKESTRFVPDPKFNTRSYDNFTHFPENGNYASLSAEQILIKSYKYDIVERRDMDSILAEHRLALSGLISASDAKQIGNFAGADAILTGRVVEAYAHFDTNTKTDGSFIGTYIAHVAIEMRLVHAKTGRILFACTTRRNSLNYLDRPLSITNHEIIKDPRILDVPLHGADGQDRVRYVIDQAVKESLASIL